MGSIEVKRVYDHDLPSEGSVFLVDRLWPRGIRRDQLYLTEWLPDVAPSDDLRKLLHEHPDRFDEFVRLYAEQLDAEPDALRPLRKAARTARVTLLFAARDRERNNAVALRDYLVRELS